MSTVAQPAQTLSIWASIPLYMIWPQCEVFYWIRVLKNNFCHLIILILYTLNPSLAFLRLLSLSKNILFWESFWYYYHGLMFIHVVICSNKIGRTIKFHFVILGHKKYYAPTISNWYYLYCDNYNTRSTIYFIKEFGIWCFS